MPKTLASFQVTSHIDGTVQTLRLVDMLDEKHLSVVEKTWLPILKDKRDRALEAIVIVPKDKRTRETQTQIVTKFGAEDSHWDWRTQQSQLKPGEKLLALVTTKTVEAVATINTRWGSRASVGKQAIYLDRLAVAPWNRSFRQQPRFRGLGKLMVAVVADIAFDMGFEGRCGLHSLIQSEGFYLKLGFRDFGIDPAYQGLKYFELEQSDAKRFLEGK